METRRRFLKTAARGVACATCSRSLVACSGEPPVAPRLEADVVLTIADYADLGEVDGMLELEREVSGHSYPIFIRKVGEDRFMALSAFCNHESCSVVPSSDGFSCPCHGAAFTADGMLTQGPATADLVEFDTQSDGTTLTIFAN